MTRYLIADPDYTSRKAIALLLTYRLHAEEIFDAVDGEELVERLAQVSPHILLVDCALPGLPAPQVFQDYRHAHPDSILVLLSVDNAHAVKARAYGAAFIFKGLSAEEVVERLRAILGPQPAV